MPTKPTIYLIAGCDGAGKTTFAKEFLPKPHVPLPPAGR